MLSIEVHVIDRVYSGINIFCNQVGDFNWATFCNNSV